MAWTGPVAVHKCAVMQRAFSKMHGLGNDFVVIDGRTEHITLDSAAVRAIADRRTGVGCDQLILIEPSDRADVSMRIFNCDGGEVAACGNATRCVPLFVGRNVTIETKAGVLDARRTADGATVDMGVPRFDWNAIPLAYAMDTREMPVGWDDLPVPAAVNIGNPHVIFFVDDLDRVDVARLGPLIEHDLLFPERVNVNFAQRVTERHLRLVVWERGAGLTRACGTGACATAVAAILRRLCASPVTVTLPGGDLVIDWQAGGPIRMTGPATRVFDGMIDLDIMA